MGIDKLIFRKREEADGCNRKKPDKTVIFIIIGAVIVLAMSGFFETGSTDKDTRQESTGYISEQMREEEKKLELILKKINGAGDVSVFISYEDGGERILARDLVSKGAKESKEDGSSENWEDEGSVVMVDDGSRESPYVTEERKPEISGVIVVAKGASNQNVRNEIYDAVRAAFGVAPHRIKITY